VHDEINISAPIEEWRDHMAHLKDVMNEDRFETPMESEGFMGQNWHEIEQCE
jgi:DNA polymerase I-like protein with 3'-5' exonuclease and polymerase domains